MATQPSQAVQRLTKGCEALERYRERPRLLRLLYDPIDARLQLTIGDPEFFPARKTGKGYRGSCVLSGQL
jgi:hypothetical protein